MVILLSLLLAASLVLLVGLWFQTRRRHVELTRALRSRSLPVREDLRGTEAARSEWDRLCLAASEILEAQRQRDYDGRRRLELLASAVDALQDAVVLVDDEGVVLLANLAFRQLATGRRDDAGLLGEKVQKLLPVPAFFTFLEDLRRERAGMCRDLEVRTVAGGRLLVAISGRLLLAEGRAAATLLVLRDVTHERALEEAKKDIIGNVSHELRTPISVIRGYSEALVEDHGRLEPAKELIFLKKIYHHSVRLSDLVDELLTVTRLDSKHPGLEFEVLDLHEEFGRMVDDVQAQAQSSGHTVEVRLAPGRARVRGDALRLSQVLENLVQNALRHTPRGTRIEVVSRYEGGEVVMGVLDNGPGIPERDLPRIFDRFYRVDKGRSRQSGGTGLGLSIVQSIIQLHGGRVWAESRVGQGSKFWFALPLVAVPASGGPAAARLTE